MTKLNKLSKAAVALSLAAITLIPAQDAFAISAKASVGAATTRSTVTTAVKPNASASRLTTIKSKSDTAIKNRVTEIGNLKTLVNASKYATASDKSGLIAELNSDETGLTSLDTQIQSDTDVATALADGKRIVSDYRIYALVVPKVHEVLALDTVASIDAKFQALSPKLAQDVQAQKAKGTDVSAALTALSDLNSKAATINTTVSGLSGPVLALQPSGYPANRTTLQSTRRSLTTIVSAAKGARADITAIQAVIGTPAAKATTTTTK